MKIQSIIDALVIRDNNEANEIALTLMQCLEILYKYIPADEDDSKMVKFTLKLKRLKI